jgi:hypothetical protein
VTVSNLPTVIAGEKLPLEPVRYGPWLGAKRSVSAEQVEPRYAVAGSNFLYLPRDGRWIRRKGQTQKFDTFGASVGLLPDNWAANPVSGSVGARGRSLQEMPGSAFSDGVPSLIALVTRETIPTGVLDDGRFSNVYVRDQVNGANYTLLAEFGSTTYPAPGTVQLLKVPALWYDSGDGGMTRGVEEFQRRFLVGGSRAMQRVQNWWYFPSLYGVPTRWSGTFTSLVGQTLYPISDAAANSGTLWGGHNSGGAVAYPNLYTCIDDTSDDDTDWIAIGEIQSQTATFAVTTTTNPGTLTGFTLTIRANSTGSAPTQKRLDLQITDSGTNVLWSHTGVGTGQLLTGTITTYTFSVTLSQAPVSWTGLNINIQTASQGGDTSGEFRIYRANLAEPSSTQNANRLMPSGPLPPCHAGTLTKGNPLAATSPGQLLAASVVSNTGWTAEDGVSTADLWDKINEKNTVADPITSDAIRAYGATTSTIVFQMNQANGTAGLGFAPGADDTVKFRWNAGEFGLLASNDLTVSLYVGGTLIHASQQTLPALTVQTTFEYELSGAEITTATGADATWSNVRLQFARAGGGATSATFVYWADVEYTPTGSAIGGWHGKDRLLYSVAYRFEDDSVWMPCTPRLPNATNSNGFNLFTVDSANPNTGYDKLTWSNIPVPPFGVKSKLLLSCVPIDSTSEDNLQLNPTDLRIVDEVDASVTSYTWLSADPLSWVLDVDNTLVRYDHIMTPRSRYVFSGDSRTCVSYSGLNPTAIILAPVGFTADYDLNVSDTSSTAFGASASYYKVTSTGLTLYRDTGAAVSTKTFAFSTYDTIEKLVDAVNETSTADTNWSGAAAQWRGQIAPGLDPHVATATYLCPTSRTISGCTVSGQSITKLGGGLSAIPVGAYVGTAGAYVSTIVSDTQLTFVGSGISTGSLTFVTGTGDTPTSGTAYDGAVRVIANSLPGFIYLNNTYLDQFPIETSAIWNTVANPKTTKCAPNAWSGSEYNKRIPAEDAGISMGGRALDNGFVTPFRKMRLVIDKEGIGPGYDQDLRLRVTNRASGCCAWQSLCSGNGVVFLFAPEGWVAQDLSEELALSPDVWLHPKSDALAGTGDYSFEMPLCAAATAADTDGAYLVAAVMRGVLWVSYRASGSTPNRQVAYDFSSGKTVAGLRALVRDADDPLAPGALYGWSTPLVRSLTAMCEGHRSDGSHLYGWNDDNAGSVGDGRIDEFEVTDQDNGTDIAGSVVGAWLRARDGRQMSAQELLIEHDSPTGSTGSFTFTRSYAGDVYTLTPSTSSSLVVSRDLKLLPFPARTPTAACYLTFSQATGGARTWRASTLWLKDLPLSYR